VGNLSASVNSGKISTFGWFTLGSMSIILLMSPYSPLSAAFLTSSEYLPAALFLFASSNAFCLSSLFLSTSAGSNVSPVFTPGMFIIAAICSGV